MPTANRAPEHRLPYRDVLAQAASRPAEVAIIAGDREVTYGELALGSSRLAAHLLAAGTSPGDVVGVCLLARPEQLMAMLAIFRIGAIYLPLDPTHPVDLISYELDEAKPRVVLTDRTSGQNLKSGASVFDDIDAILADSSSVTPSVPDTVVPLDSTAFVLFTSGTTGRPKGVRATHRNLAQFVQSARDAYGFCVDDVFCSIARYTFSISMFELMSPLTVGARLYVSRREDVLQPEFLAALLDKVTVLHAGPSLLSRLSRFVNEHRPGSSFSKLRHVSTGGDIVLPDVMERMKVLFPKAELFVIYGCTEIACMGTEYRIPLDETCTKTYVGKPFPGVGVQLIDTEGRLAPAGQIGEICFSGAGLAAGYLNRPEVDAEKFVQIEEVRHYRTGDLGCFDADGQLEFLGRNDFQVQIRGMRVELLGIENAVRELRLADECAATLRHFGDDDERLVAFVTGHRALPLEIRARLSERFPDFMVPAHVIPVDTLPLTVNGKLDRRGLQNLPIRTQPKAEGNGGARSKMEERIMRTFAATLGAESLEPEDNFFDLGGHSLLAVELAERLQETLGMPVSPGDVLQAPTARKLVAHLSGERLHRPIPLNACTARERMFLVMGVHAYRELAKQLEPHFSVYGVYVEHELSFLDGSTNAIPIPVLASRYLEVIRRESPSGPYHLVGHSFGGLLAYEIARQMVEAGETVTHVGMLDTMLLDAGWRGILRRGARLLRQSPLKQLAWVTRRLRSMRSAKRADFGRHEGGRFAEMELQREQAYKLAEVAYARDLKPLLVPTTLIIAGKRLERMPLEPTDAGWTRATDNIRQRLVDADHLEMLDAPAVADVAAILASSDGRVHQVSI